MGSAANQVEWAIWKRLTALRLGASWMGLPIGNGRVFYVDHFLGDDANDGFDPGEPLETITYALTQCMNDRNDYIIVLDCFDNEPIFPIPVAVTRVHIIGLAQDTMMPQTYPTISGGGVGAVFSLEGCHYAEIAGFNMLSAGQACIEIPVVSTAIRIHRCAFGMTGAALNGILSAINDAPNYSVIEHCIFGWQLTGDGIVLPSPTKTILRKNVFNSLAGIGINLGTGVPGVGIVGDIIGNQFFSPIVLALAAGWAITIENGGAIISGNRACQTGDNTAVTATNPYLDLSTGLITTCLNGWSDNFDGQALSAGPDVV